MCLQQPVLLHVSHLVVVTWLRLQDLQAVVQCVTSVAPVAHALPELLPAMPWCPGISTAAMLPPTAGNALQVAAKRLPGAHYQALPRLYRSTPEVSLACSEFCLS